MAVNPMTIQMGIMAAKSIYDTVDNHNRTAQQRKIAERNSHYAEDMASRNAEMYAREAENSKKLAHADYRRQQAATRVGAVGSGVSLGSGSALELLSGAAASHAMNLSRIGYDSKIKAAQERNKGAMESMRWRNEAARHRADKVGTALSIGSSLMSLGGGGFGQ